MGLKKGPSVVADTVSVDDPYSEAAGAILLAADGDFEIVATVEVCVKQPQRTQVSIDSMAQIALEEDVGQIAAIDEDSDLGVLMSGPVTFEVTYEILRNGDVIATINDEMDYEAPVGTTGRHTNFPNFPIVDNNPRAGINTYALKITRVFVTEPVKAVINVFVASRSLKATVFPV
ncbi:hypothetical protein VQL36_16165 [Chengkuizengella sp. SCS-71B]|uniref:hypothetical protein n=1 Tax=Chengkuizengella sp. SCS-71B TaxID=3115290 RepID=UPI0032C20D03